MASIGPKTPKPPDVTPTPPPTQAVTVQTGQTIQKQSMKPQIRLVVNDHAYEVKQLPTVGTKGLKKKDDKQIASNVGLLQGKLHFTAR